MNFDVYYAFTVGLALCRVAGYMKSGESDNPTLAVLTGDVVGSSREDKPDSWVKLLQEAGVMAQEAFPNAGIYPIDIFRGDSWQLAVEDAAKALRVALFIRALVRSRGPSRRPYWDTRIAIGIGMAEKVVAAKISQSTGPVFTLSGSLLDELSEAKRSFLVVQHTGKKADAIYAALPPLIDAVVDNWTPKQAAAVMGSLRGWTQEKIAGLQEPPIDRTTLNQHLAKAHWEALQKALQAVEAVHL